MINSVSIDNGNPYTNNPVLTISFSAVDAGSGLYQIRFSETTDFSNSKWQVINVSTTSVNYSLTTGNVDGLKTIYTQVMDYAGNIAQYNGSNQITLDTKPPTASFTAYPQTGGDLLNLNATAQDLNGIQKVEFDIDGSFSQNLSPSSGNLYSALLAASSLTDGQHTFTINVL